MSNFRKDGVYLKMFDMAIEGYQTMGRNGKLKRHKYSLLEKLMDIREYGKTNTIGCDYVFFVDTYLFIGGIVEELSSLLESWRRTPYPEYHPSRVKQFSIIADGCIEYYDTGNRKCSLNSFRDGTIIGNHYFDYEKETFENKEYQFYSFPS